MHIHTHTHAHAHTRIHTHAYTHTHTRIHTHVEVLLILALVSLFAPFVCVDESLSILSILVAYVNSEYNMLAKSYSMAPWSRVRLYVKEQ